MESSITNWGIRDAARFLGITVPTAYNWVYQRKIPYRKHGGRLVFNKRTLEEWSRKREYQEIDDE